MYQEVEIKGEFQINLKKCELIGSVFCNLCFTNYESFIGQKSLVKK